jgi:hypothetical protein
MSRFEDELRATLFDDADEAPKISPLPAPRRTRTFALIAAVAITVSLLGGIVLAVAHARTTSRDEAYLGSTTVEAQTTSSPSTPVTASPTPVPTSSTPTGPVQSAQQDLERLADAVPNYPNSIVDGQGEQVTINDSGHVVLSRSRRVPDRLADVAGWFRSRYPNSDQSPETQVHAEFNITAVITSQVRVAVFSPMVAVILDKATNRTTMTVIASGTALPNRTSDMTIPLADIVSATITWSSDKSTGPTTRSISAGDTATLIRYLNAAPLVAPATYTGRPGGVESTLTFVATNQVLYEAMYSSTSPLNGTDLVIGGATSRRLDLPAPYYSLLSALTS